MFDAPNLDQSQATSKKEIPSCNYLGMDCK